MELKIGDKVPDFTLKDQNQNDVKLSDFKGKKVLLSFHPLAWTGVCADQMKSLEDNMETFSQLNTVPLGISVDQPFTKSAWAKELGISNVRLLADFWPHGGTANSMGLFREKEGITQRANVIVDEEGKVAFIKIYDIPELPDIHEIIDVLKK
jgi:peroxiredoxin